MKYYQNIFLESSVRIFCLKRFFIKQLDKCLVETIQSRCLDLADYLGVDHKYGETDFHRVIYHYEYELQKAHSVKMDNYGGTYGFLRAVTFIFNCLFLYLIIEVSPNFDLSSRIDWNLVTLISCAGILTYLFFMGYMKFNRRFTLESFMCLIIDTSYQSHERSE